MLLPRSACIQDPVLINGLAIGNFLIFVAYCCIPWSIRRISMRIKRAGFEPPEHFISKLFKAFIFSCGLTHLLGSLVFFFPWFHVENVLIWVTAIISLLTSQVLSSHVAGIASAIVDSMSLERTLAGRGKDVVP